MDLEKRYDPKCEENTRDRWFKALHQDQKGTPYTVVFPPPNVTGRLHLGHALGYSVEDAAARYHRKRGKSVRWPIGVDHAGIATQMMVRKDLEAKGHVLADMSRETFLEHARVWKNSSQNAIIDQMRVLGLAFDDRQIRFTLDPDLSHAVVTAFVRLFKEGLLYRAERLVNWDPVLKTAISDLELDMRESQGTLWKIFYAFADGSEGGITVATTRPETLFGDVAVAVHPEDARYKDAIGRAVRVPVSGQTITIIADAMADPEKGTGAVKITPAHDFADFATGQRHGLPNINIMTDSAHLNDAVPEAFRGLDRFVARRAVLKVLRETGALIEETPWTHTVPYTERSGVPAEPRLTTQWFVNTHPLAEEALRVVREGEIRFVPESCTAVYNRWLENIQPWCISRQLVWGHRIPAWYGPDGRIFVGETLADVQAEADAHYKEPTALVQDPDVLDTWFSSALWPFSTLGWPQETAEMAARCPSDLLVTGFDIIFFWVARMVMAGQHLCKRVPFRTVYINPLVRDKDGKKMSKTRGNVVDPMDLVGEYGADALRFALLSRLSGGQDLRFDVRFVDGARKFVTKLWNAARFCQQRGAVWGKVPFVDFHPAHPINLWIVAKASETVQAVADAYDALDFSEAATRAYSFVWDTFCDWYLEFAKDLLQTPEFVDETQATMGWALEQIVHALHPVMPFVTEALWSHFREGLLMEAPWPDAVSYERPEIAEVDALIASVQSARSAGTKEIASAVPFSTLCLDMLVKKGFCITTQA